jgi:hypothetical protein
LPNFYVKQIGVVDLFLFIILLEWINLWYILDTLLLGWIKFIILQHLLVNRLNLLFALLQLRLHVENSSAEGISEFSEVVEVYAVLLVILLDHVVVLHEGVEHHHGLLQLKLQHVVYGLLVLLLVVAVSVQVQRVRQLNPRVRNLTLVQHIIQVEGSTFAKDIFPL